MNIGKLFKEIEASDNRSLGFDQGDSHTLSKLRILFPVETHDIHMTDDYIAISNKLNPDDNNYSHYIKDVRHLAKLDLYQLGEIFQVEDYQGSIHHAMKKLLAGGKRGFKGKEKDVAEAIMTLLRYLEIKGFVKQKGKKEEKLELTFNKDLWS